MPTVLAKSRMLFLGLLSMFIMPSCVGVTVKRDPTTTDNPYCLNLKDIYISFDFKTRPNQTVLWIPFFTVVKAADSAFNLSIYVERPKTMRNITNICIDTCVIVGRCGKGIDIMDSITNRKISFSFTDPIIDSYNYNCKFRPILGCDTFYIRANAKITIGSDSTFNKPIIQDFFLNRTVKWEAYLPLVVNG